MRLTIPFIFTWCLSLPTRHLYNLRLEGTHRVEHNIGEVSCAVVHVLQGKPTNSTFHDQFHNCFMYHLENYGASSQTVFCNSIRRPGPRNVSSSCSCTLSSSGCCGLYIGGIGCFGGLCGFLERRFRLKRKKPKTERAPKRAPRPTPTPIPTFAVSPMPLGVGGCKANL
jgi:hypothetical protein